MAPFGRTICNYAYQKLDKSYFLTKDFSTKNLENIQENKYLSENNIKSIRDTDFP